MRLFHKILLNLSVLVSFIIILFAFHEKSRGNLNLINYDKQIKVHNETDSHFVYLRNPTTVSEDRKPEFNIWCIFCKATSNSPLKYKFSVFSHSLVSLSSVPLNINIITDSISQPIAEDVMSHVRNDTKKHFEVLEIGIHKWPSINPNVKEKFSIKQHLVTYHDIKKLAEESSDIIKTMRLYFTSQPDSYYSDALFFISLGLHRIALNQTQAIMIDIDTKVDTDIKLLFNEFNKFGKEALVGIAPEQSPVYRHVLYMYRAKYRDTNFGKPLSQDGNPGVNSGVLLLQLSRMRNSELYNKLLTHKQVKRLVDKYMFHGHLGDQDWYTLISQEYKHLIHLLHCTWNRQLCQWWSHHGYEDIFNMFYHCEGDVRIYHGNCNTKIP